MTKTVVYKRYSDAFKRQVAAEYESGESAASLCRKYGIGKIDSVTRWVRQFGSAGLRHQVLHIQTPEEADRLHQLERERDVLRQALADLTVKNLLLEGQVQVYQETYGADALKKNAPLSSSTRTPEARAA